MVISYGLLAFYIGLSCFAGVIVGAILVAMFSSSQVTSLQRQLDAQTADIKALEERCKTLRKSNAALGGYIHKRTWRAA